MRSDGRMGAVAAAFDLKAGLVIGTTLRLKSLLCTAGCGAYVLASCCFSLSLTLLFCV